MAVNCNLHGRESAKATMGIELNCEEEDVKYEPGDHVGVVPCNNEVIVARIIKCLDLAGFDPDLPIVLQYLRETHTSTGKHSSCLKTLKRLPF